MEENLSEYEICILNNIDAIIYVVDIQTYELLFINKYAKKALNVSPKNTATCWKQIYSEYKPCSFCNLSKLILAKSDSKKPYIQELKNPLNNRWYQSYSRIIKLADRIVRIEVSYDITDRKSDEKSLFKLLNQQTVISKISKIFNSTQDLTAKVSTSVELLGKQVDSQRVLIYHRNEKNNELYLVHQWNDSNLEAVQEQNRVLQYSDFPNLIRLYKSDEIIRMNQRNRFSVSEAAFFYSESINCLLIVPIYIDEKLNGYLYLTDENSEKQWQLIEKELIRTFVNIYSAACKREFAENKIKESEQKYKTLSETLQISEKKLKELNNTKDKFFSIVAHDLKNPFNVMIGFSDLLLSKFQHLPEEKMRFYLGLLHQSASESYNLLENLLEWSRSQRGKIVIKKVHFQIIDIIEETLAFLNSSAAEKNILLQQNVADEVVVFGDKITLKTVFRNLISNAIKFTRANGTIEVSAFEKEKNGEKYIEIAVKDNGVGISKTDISKLFRLDVNHSTEGTGNEKGTGLGLILCKELIEKNDGYIYIESEVNIGSSFIFGVQQGNFFEIDDSTSSIVYH